MKLGTKLLSNLVGLALVLLAWFNPFNLDVTVRAVIFIIGFDMIGIILKIGIFIFNLFFPFDAVFGYLSWTLLLLLLPELAIAYTEAYKPYRLLIKPLAVFAVACLSLGLQPALIAGGIDLLINLTHKIRVGKKYKKYRRRK